MNGRVVDGWMARNAHCLVHKLLSGNISVSVTACGRSICVPVCVDKNLYTLRFGDIQKELSWKQLNQGQPSLDSESQEVGRAF